MRHGLLVAAGLASLLLFRPQASAETLDAQTARLVEVIAARYPGQAVLVNSFVNSADNTPCGPIARQIEQSVHQAIIRSGKLKVVMSTPEVTDDPIIVQGTFSINSGQGIGLSLVAGRGTEKLFDGQAAMPLPTPGSAEAACVYVLEPDGRSYLVNRDVIARDAPMASGRHIDTFSAGQTILVEKRLRGTPWKIVDYASKETGLSRRVFIEANTGRDITPK